MELQPHDLHFVMSESARRLKCFNVAHLLIWQAECHNSTVNEGTYSRFGNCPPGVFILGPPRRTYSPPFGFYFTLLSDFDHHTSLHDWGRSGIGIHGGGSGLPHPFAPHQGWVRTEGCLRLQNSDNGHFVQLVQGSQKAGGRCYLTVSP